MKMRGYSPYDRGLLWILLVGVSSTLMPLTRSLTNQQNTVQEHQVYWLKRESKPKNGNYCKMGDVRWPTKTLNDRIKSK